MVVLLPPTNVYIIFDFGFQDNVITSKIITDGDVRDFDDCFGNPDVFDGFLGSINRDSQLNGLNTGLLILNTPSESFHFDHADSSLIIQGIKDYIDWSNDCENYNYAQNHDGNHPSPFDCGYSFRFGCVATKD